MSRAEPRPRDYLGCIVSAVACMLLARACAGFSGTALCFVTWSREPALLRGTCRCPGPLKALRCMQRVFHHCGSPAVDITLTGLSEHARSTHSHAPGCDMQDRRTQSRRLGRRVHSATLGMLTVPKSTTSCSRRLRFPSRAALSQAARLTHVPLTPRQRRWPRWLRVRAQRLAQPGRQPAAREAGWRQCVRAGAKRCLTQRLRCDLPPMVRP